MTFQQYLSLIVSLLLIHPALQGGAPTGSADISSAASITVPLLPKRTAIGTIGAAPKYTPSTPIRLRARQTNAVSSQSRVLPGQVSTLLPDGRVLLTGGEGDSGPVSVAYIKDGKTEPTELSAQLLKPRAYHTATVLPNGKVLIAGGATEGNQVLAESELFDPSLQTFQAYASNLDGRAHYTATLLPDGRLLIVGGVDVNGNTLDTVEFWSYRTQSVQAFSSALLVPRQDHTAVLRSDGTVRIHGGTNSNGSTPASDEIIDPSAGTIQALPSQAQDPTAQGSPVIQSLPTDGTANVAIDSVLSLQFSSPVRVETLTAETVTLTANDQPVPIHVVAAQDGLLAFITAAAPLQGETQYTLSAQGIQDRTGSALPAFQASFTTAEDLNAANVPANSTAINATGPVRNAATGGRQAGDDPAVAPLQANPGLTALSGETRTVAGKYLPNVTFNLDCDGNRGTGKSDNLGRFLIVTQGSGHCEMEIDGTTAHLNGEDYGRYYPGIDLTAGQTNVLPYTVWLTPIDHAHEVTIPSPTTSEIVVTTPHLRGLELHLPPRTIIRDYNGEVVNRIGMTRIPIRRPPFPLPNNVPVPVYFTIQPGGAFVEVGGSRYTNGKGAQLIYPNTHRAPAGTLFNFWDYDPDGQGWYSYGTGHVSSNRRSIVPDPGTVIHRLTGAMVATPDTAPPNGPSPSNNGGGLLCWLGLCSGGGGGKGGGNGSGGNGTGGPDPFPHSGDPIDPATGLFVYRVTDYTLPDVIPFNLTRTYRQGDPILRAFGAGTSQDLDMFLVGDFNTYQYFDLIMADGSRVHYTRTSPGTFWGDAAFISNTGTTGFFGSTIIWATDGWYGWELTLKNGAVLYFPEAAGQTNPLKSALEGVKDRYGNTLTLTRDGGSGVLTNVTTQNGRFISFTYNANGQVVQAQDNLGRTTAYSYDDGGRLVQVTDPAGGITQYTYDANDQMLSITDSRGNVVLANQYNTDGHVIQQTQADNTQFNFSYTVDVNGNITGTQVTDPRGTQRNLSFSQSGYFTGGQLLTEVRAVGKPEQQTYTYAWDPATGLLTSIVDPLNRTTSYTYDTNGNKTGTTFLSGTSNAVSVSTTYSSTFNEVASVTDPLNRTVQFGYDASGNLTTITKPLNLVTTNTFNSQGQLVSSTPAGAGPITIGYTSGLPSTLSNALNNQVTVTEDVLGRVTQTADPLGNTSSYQYDADGRVLIATDALHNQTQYSYDSNGNLLSVTDAGGGTTHFTYDNRNRIQTRQDPLLANSQFTYDPNGNLSTLTDRKGQTTQFTYDGLNRLTQITYADQSTINYTYDSGNRITQAVDSLTGTTTYSYDPLNHLLSLSNSLGTVSYTYNAAGQRTSMTVSGQQTVNYTYDAAGRLSQLSQGTATVTIAYDSAGRRSSLTLPNGVVVSYSYDAASRLGEIDYANASGLLGSLTYQYDAAGRRTAVGGTLAQTALPAALSNASYNAANQLVQWNSATLTYDANGNLTNDGTLAYAWDARNQLASITGSSLSASFGYDFSGRRIGKQINGTHYNFLFDGMNVVQEQSVGYVTANLLTGFGTDETFSRTDSTGTYSFLADGINSTLALTDASGNIGPQYTYDPFGNTSQSGSSTNTFQFTGRENDGTGLYYLRARYYSPGLQRFISQDPIGFAGGINLYVYSANNPVSLIDSTGTDPAQHQSGPFGGEPNPYVAVGADALGIAGAATGHLGLGIAGALASLGNELSVPNAAMNGISFVPVVGEAVGAVTAVQDVGSLVGQFITNNILAPIFNAAPPQQIDNGNGVLIPNAGATEECQFTGGCP